MQATYGKVTIGCLIDGIVLDRRMQEEGVPSRNVRSECSSAVTVPVCSS